ncbi:MAG: hypothetical protein BWY85_01211 [Firmicutes bacterium ADurb.Bin506]|nr:MAG: hypothetical protein BWY85_01211 [Firmicutes bacterium ADurb.Bin506]
MKPKFQYGGQAVIEGVMMRGREGAATAVRRPDGTIVVNTRSIDNSRRPAFLKLPFIRGTVALVESLTVGMQALMYSANEASEEGEQLSAGELTLSLALALGLFILLFIVTPNVIVGLVQRLIKSVIVVNLIEGVLRMAIFVVYLAVISRLKDIQRVFAYHGAEHKTIAAWEAGEELTVENARPHGCAHPRCGTSFLLLVMVVSILVYSVLGKQTVIMRILTRIALLPVLSGISYELLKLAGRPNPSTIVRWLSAPGMALQRLTTREPDDSMLEVAIASIKAAIEMDNAKGNTTADPA